MSTQKESESAEAASVHAPTTIPEEPTPESSAASPRLPAHSEASALPTVLPSQQAAGPQEGRFIEIISTDGSRASAEANAGAQPPQHVGTRAATSNGHPEAEMKAIAPVKPVSNVFRRNSKKSNAQPSNLHAAAPVQSSDGHTQQVSPSTDSTTQHPSPHTNDSTTPSTESGRHHSRAFKKIKGERSSNQDGAATGDTHRDEDNEDDDDVDESHPILAALYPLSNFIGFRPLSHPHTPAERRLTPQHPRFNRFHYICGRILTLGLPPVGDSGEVARYRDPHTGEIELVRMYRDQVGAKTISLFHTLIAAWVVIALISLMSRSSFYREHHTPIVIGAFATEAVVTFVAFRTPLAQPKNIFFGNFISSIIGVAMQKAFEHTNYVPGGIGGVDYAAAATAVGVAVFAMNLLGVVHPPGAAIALLSLTNPQTSQLGWWLLPVVITSSLVVIGWALIINNVGGRRYPENWFYLNAFAEPPIIGPEKLPFTNAPYEPRPSRFPKKRKRSGEKPQGPENAEKGFYRIPDSGARVTQGYGVASEPEPKPKSTTVPEAGDASHNLGGAGRVRHGVDSGSQEAPGSRYTFGTGAIVNTNRDQQDAGITRPPEVAKVESTESSAPGQAGQAVVSSNGQRGSRMIENDPALMSRNNSKGSKRSRKSLVVHVNENRRHSTGSSSSNKVSAVPAVQWRAPE